jgi:hypothetical protein
MINPAVGSGGLNIRREPHWGKFMRRRPLGRRSNLALIVIEIASPQKRGSQ